jgi:hypothetical protein
MNTQREVSGSTQCAVNRMVRTVATIALLAFSILVAERAYSRPQFEIIGGQDSAVCRAYEQALRTMAKNDPHFAQRPTCDGIVNPSVDGFPSLKRIFITNPNDAFALYYQIESFLATQDQYGYLWKRALEAKEANRKLIEEQLKFNKLQMWTYSPPLDIDNDGKPDTLLWFRAGHCSSPRPVRSIVLIVDPNSFKIDKKKSQRLFGDSRPYPIKTDRFIQLRNGSVGVFRFADKNYIYAWGNDKAWSSERKLEDTVRVTMWHGRRESTECEVRWNGSA